MRLRTVLSGAAMVAASFIGATLVMLVWPAGERVERPPLAEVPPLPAVSGTSTVLAPTVIALSALREALEAQAPLTLSGSRDYSIAKLFSNAEIAFTVNRGPLGVFGKPDMVGISSLLSGTMRVSGRTLDQRVDIRGYVAVIAQPQLTSAWRLEPNLTAQVTLADAAMTIGGVKLSAGSEIRPMLERQINERVAEYQARLGSDPFLEQAIRRQWVKLCRSYPLAAGAAGLPNLWLELRPRRAIAAQPRVDGEAVTLLLGVEAETRIVHEQTTPDCPFPAELAIVPRSEQGGFSVTVPIDLPFTEVNRLLEAQLAGSTFPDESGALAVTVRHASVAPSGDRLLITLRARVFERKSWPGLVSEATVYVWGRPMLDPATQRLRLDDITLDLPNGGSAAARAAGRYLEAALAERAVIDLSPFAAKARESIETAIAGFRAAGDGVRVDASVTDLRLVEIAFDATTLRITAEADGAARVSITSLPK